VIKAKVLRSSTRMFDCRCLLDGKLIQALALGNLLKEDSIVVGDFVCIEQQEDSYTIVKVLPRQNEMYRLSIREGRKKIIAANCDYLIIQSSVSRPEYKRGIVDRFLIRAAEWNIPALVIFNKMDQFDSEKMDIQFESERLRPLNVSCYEISAVSPERPAQILSLGFSQLKQEITGKTSIFLGQSGVGKSKTISALSGGEIELKSNEVGKIGKGAHTTTWSEIIELGSFSLIDSPGIRSFSLEDIDPDHLMNYFPDLCDYAALCKFTNCSHEADAVGCYFYNQELSSKGNVKAIHSRLDSYLRILNEISQIPHWQKRSLKK